MPFKLVIIGLLFFIKMYLSAQVDTINMEEVQISSSRIIGSALDIGRDIEIIQGADLEQLSIHRVDEALKYLTGIDIQSRGPRGVQSDISLRGSTFNQVLVLVDGVRANDPLTGHFNLYLPVLQSHISRIEIIKGASSGIYGADAVGGVINVVTKRKPDVIIKPNDIDARITGGSYGLKEGEVGVISTINKQLTIGGGVLINETSGESYADTLRRNFSFLTLSAFADWQPTKRLRLGVRQAYDHRSFNAQYFYTRSTFDESIEDIKRSWSQLNGTYRLNDKSYIESDMLYSRTLDDFLFNPLFPGNNHTTTLVNSNIRYKYQGNLINWTIGVNQQYQKIQSNDRGNHQFSRVGGYVIGLLQAAPSLTVLSGLRIDYDENIETSVSPHISASYRLSKYVSLRASAGRATRSPDFTEKYISNNLTGPLSSGRNIGNPNLLAERSWSYDFGVDVLRKGGFSLSSSLFYRSSSNLIDFAITSGADIHNPELVDPTADYFYARNISSLKNFGAEVRLKTRSKLNRNMSLNTLSAITIQDQSSNTDIISKYISSSADIIYNQTILLNYKSHTLGWLILYKHHDEDQATAINADLKSHYLIHNMSLSSRLIKNRVTIKAEVNNAFDIDYADILGAQLPGRWIEVSLLLNL